MWLSPPCFWFGSLLNDLTESQGLSVHWRPVKQAVLAAPLVGGLRTQGNESHPTEHVDVDRGVDLVHLEPFERLPDLLSA